MTGHEIGDVDGKLADGKLHGKPGAHPCLHEFLGCRAIKPTSYISLAPVTADPV